MNSFRPGVLPTVVVFLLLPLLLWLGFWQLDRAEQKKALYTQLQARQQQAPVTAQALINDTNPSFRQVTLTGHFDLEQRFLLDNRTRDGLAGVELLQPFWDEPSARWFLINRGWLRFADRTRLPAFTTPTESVVLNAWVYVPQGTAFVLKDDTPSSNPIALINDAQPQLIWQTLNRTGYAYELRLNAGPYAHRVDWPQQSPTHHKHTGYAVQWFALATALIGLFIYFGVYHARERTHESSFGRT